MSGTFGEATGGEEADRKYGREDRLREELLGGGGGVAKGEGGEAEGAGVRSGGAIAESLPPALSQPHAWLQSLLIVIAVQTRPTAATNISC